MQPVTTVEPPQKETQETAIIPVAEFNKSDLSEIEQKIIDYFNAVPVWNE